MQRFHYKFSLYISRKEPIKIHFSLANKSWPQTKMWTAIDSFIAPSGEPDQRREESFSVYRGRSVCAALYRTLPNCIIGD
jgi:hypothetical protein